MEQKNLTVEEAAQILKVSKATVWNMCKRHALPAFKLPGTRRWLIDSKDLDKLQKDLKRSQYGNK